MKKASIVWLILIFIAGVAGFAISVTHNRPRLAVNAYSLNLLLDSPEDETLVTPTSECNSEETPWDNLNCRFNYYEGKAIPYTVESWNIKDRPKKVKVYYNTVTNEVVVVCRKLKCEPGESHGEGSYDD
jgi:hypothetical protein